MYCPQNMYVYVGKIKNLIYCIYKKRKTLLTGTWKIWHSSSTGLDYYALADLSDVVMMNTMATNIEGEAKVWVMRLHDEDALELEHLCLPGGAETQARG